MCRFNRFNELGYSAPLALSEAVREWADIHGYALDAIAHNAMFTHGGVDYNIAQPHVMTFSLQVIRDRADHVSKAFWVKEACIRHKRDLYPLLTEPFKPTAILARRKQAEELRKFDVKSGHRLAGMLPVVYTVAETTVVSHSTTPAYRPFGHPDTETPDKVHREVFQDVDQLCKDAIASGIVFGVPNDTKRILPDIGTYVREGRKGWTMHKDFGLWEGVIDPLMADNPTRYVSGQPAIVIWALHENW